LRVRYDKRADIHEAFLSLGVRPDVLAIAAQDMEKPLRPMQSFPGVHRRGRCFSAGIKSCGLLGGGSGWQALDIGKHYGV
jgi:hypothetical protein